MNDNPPQKTNEQKNNEQLLRNFIAKQSKKPNFKKIKEDILKNYIQELNNNFKTVNDFVKISEIPVPKQIENSKIYIIVRTLEKCFFTENELSVIFKKYKYWKRAFSKHYAGDNFFILNPEHENFIVEKIYKHQIKEYLGRN